MSYRRPNGQPRRAHVKIDKFELFELIRAHHLKPRASSLLLALTLLADFRNHEWLGNISDLSLYLRMGRKTVQLAIEDLTVAGLVMVMEPMRPNHQGCLRITAYAALVTDARQVVTGLPEASAEIAPNPLPDRNAIASNRRQLTRIASENSPSGGSEVVRQRGGEADWDGNPEDHSLDVFLSIGDDENDSTAESSGIAPAGELRDLPLPHVGTCRICRVTTVMTDDVGPICTQCFESPQVVDCDLNDYEEI